MTSIQFMTIDEIEHRLAELYAHDSRLRSEIADLRKRVRAVDTKQAENWIERLLLGDELHIRKAARR